jgi:hypothetical protein
MNNLCLFKIIWVGSFRVLSNGVVFLDTGLDVMLCLWTEWITKYFDGLLEMLLIKRKIRFHWKSKDSYSSLFKEFAISLLQTM